MGLRLAVDGREWVRGKRTGIGRYLETMLGGLLEVRPGWEIILFLGPDGEERVDAPAITSRRLPSGPTPWVDQVALPRGLRRAGAEVFLSPYLKMPWRAPCPAAVTIHDLFPLTLPPGEGGLPWPGRLRMRLTAALSTARADAVVTVSDSSARAIREELGPAEEKLHVSPEGVAPFFYEAPGDEVAGPGSPYVMALSNFQPHKNIEILLRAWEGASQQVQDALLVLAGDGPRRHRLQAEWADRPGGDRVRWPGTLGDEELRGLYRGACALLQPSFSEGFGLPVAEAMACGTPVVVSDRGCLPEVAGEAGRILDPGDAEGWLGAMVRLLEDKEERSRLGQAAASRAERFRPGRAASELAEVLEGLRSGSR